MKTKKQRLTDIENYRVGFGKDHDPHVVAVVQFVIDVTLDLYKKKILEALPKERDVNWQDINTPEMVAKQSEAYGHNECLREIKQIIEKI